MATVATAAVPQRPAGAIRRPAQRGDACFASILSGAMNGTVGTAGTAKPAAPAGPAVARPAAPASTAMPLGSVIGRSVGSGQCVALVQAARPEYGRTASWTRGDAVRGNLSIAPGTPIATFSRDGRYTNATDGSSHAALYLGQTAEGVQVLDQWRGNAAAVRTIPWSNPGGNAANTGSAFHVVRSGAVQHA